MSTIIKTPLEIMVEAAEVDNFTLTDMLRDQIKADFADTYVDIDTVEESIKYTAEMIPVIESSDRQSYYVELDNVVKYMNSQNVRDIKEAVENIAECNDLSLDSMVLVIESQDYAESILKEARNDEDKLKKVGKANELLRGIKNKGLKINKKICKEDALFNEFCVALYNILPEEIINENSEELIEEAASIDKLKKRKDKYENILSKLEAGRKQWNKLSDEEKKKEKNKRLIIDVLKAAAIGFATGSGSGLVAVSTSSALLNATGGLAAGFVAGTGAGVLTTNNAKKGKPTGAVTVKEYDKLLDKSISNYKKAIKEIDEKIKKLK